MESAVILNKLKNIIKQLYKLHSEQSGLNKEKATDLEKKEYSLISKIVNCFHEILSDNFNSKNEEHHENKEIKENDNYYWSFISKHFNTPVVCFCRIFERDESNKNEGNTMQQKGKNWIYFSILEHSLYDSINEIYKRNLNEKYYEQNAIINKCKTEISDILKELQQFNFINIMNKDFEKYLEYQKKKTNPKPNYNEENFDNDLNLGQSPIINHRQDNNKNSGFLLNSEYNMSNINYQSEFLTPEENDYDNFLNMHLEIIKEQTNKEEEGDKKYTQTKFGDFSPSIVDNFYTFNNVSIIKEEIKKEEEEEDKNEDENNNLNLNSLNDINEEDIIYSNNNSDKQKQKTGLLLNPKISKYLPTDNLYEINEKANIKDYTKNDILIYKKKKRPISNCLLLYLNKYYKKAPFHKFYKHNLNNRPITLKDQNYQCFICLKKIRVIFDIPISGAYWCSYYMRFVCKDCIDSEISIIPHFVLKKWNFEKFSISKRAKNSLRLWYDKPVIYFKKNDRLLAKIFQLNKVIKIKKIINNIFDIMRCKDRFKFVEDTLGEYDYLALKENLFSLKDLVEINNKTFFKKINQFKNKFIQHISGECPDCKFEGEKCSKCGFEEKIFFYNVDEVFYCKKCRKSYHKRCIGIVGHVH